MIGVPESCRIASKALIRPRGTITLQDDHIKNGEPAQNGDGRIGGRAR